MEIPQLQDWATWPMSTFTDEHGNPQTVGRCPTCGAIVGDPHKHASWHLEMEV